MNLPKYKLFLPIVWFTFSYMFILFLLVTLMLNQKPKTEIKYSVFASTPQPISASTEDSIQAEDSRAAVIDQYFAKHKCPLTGTGKKMVELADKYNFEFWWLPAIAWQESTCGKRIIEGSYNAWGYDIFGDRARKFESWDDAMEMIALDLSNNFFKKGLTEPCDVEKRYTPPSKGRWCKSIKYFRDEMLEYKTPSTSKNK